MMISGVHHVVRQTRGLGPNIPGRSTAILTTLLYITVKDKIQVAKIRNPKSESLNKRGESTGSHMSLIYT